MGKKKPSRGVVDDDEYSFGVDLSDDRPPLQDTSSMQSHDDDDAAANNNKNKVSRKASGGKVIPTSAAGADEDDEQVAVKNSKHEKSSRSHFTVSAFGSLEGIEDDNGDAIDLEEKNHDHDEEELAVSFSGKKKGSKKGGRKANVQRDDFDAEFGIVNKAESGEEDDLLKKSKPKNSGSLSAFGELEGINYSAVDLEESNQDAEVNQQAVSFSGKKKSSKSSKKVSNMFDVVSQDNDTQQVEEMVDEPVISFSGKKESSTIAKKSVFTLNLLDDENEGIADDGKYLEDDTETITFSGRKKSSKNAKKIAVDTSLPEGDDNKSFGTNQPIGNNDVDVKAVQDDVDTSKKLKKNKKKNARTAKEEEDLDKILDELGAKPLSAPLAEQTQAPVEIGIGAEEEKEGQAEASESAASKKKKKRKEKEKEKKAAAASTAAVDDKAEDAKNKVSEKKIPKHVREMQEQLARRKEAEERKKREEEEKLRKEEEERKRQEELERLAEEAKRRKKEREKEKILKKKQEGKLLTGKQKELQRRLEAMRNQILAQEGVALPSADTVTKRPKYERKKSKPASIHFNDKVEDKIAGPVDVDATEERTHDSETCIEVEKVNEDSFSALSDERMAENGAEVEDEEDDDEWDAKSWDDAEVVALPLKSAFDEEEAEESLGRKVGTIKHSPATIVSVPLSSTRLITTNITAKEMTHSDSNQITRSKNQEVVASKPKVQEIANSQESKAVEDMSKKSSENLRSPICCILGHVDTGKTKLLDCIRGTNVQEGEAGGITQQIGATYFPAESIRDRTKELKADAKLLVPGLLVIDTPGHESFTNLRSRGSGLCDIAILVVDIMHGLEPQTIESLNLLKMRNTEFIVALNKVDRLYGWKAFRNAPIGKSMKLQSVDVQNEFKRRLTEVITQFKEQGLNTELYYKNREMGQTFSIVPTSAITGEGIPDLLLLLVQWTQKTMEKKLLFVNEVQCTVLEVKVDPGHGITIDVILVNGVLHAGDQIVVCGMQGPIVTTIRALLTPHPMKELRIKGGLLSHDQIKAAQGVKIAAQGLDHAIAGTGLHVVRPDDDLEAIMDAAMQDVNSVLSRIDKSGEGVCVQASTLGSLEALLEFLKSPAVKIPVSGISIGPVHKKDVMRASVMLERKKEYATILAFDVKVTPEARELAEEAGVKIFCADIIYHLFDQFKAYIDNLKEEKKKEAAEEAVFPCVLKIMPNCIFNKKDPIVLGVDILEGLAKVGTPVCVPSRDFIDIGRIASIEINHRQVDIAKKGQKVAIKIVGSNPEEQQKMYGRHFEIDDELVSHITRKSIDVLKANYREDLSIEEWKLVVKLKNIFKIQ